MKSTKRSDRPERNRPVCVREGRDILSEFVVEKRGRWGAEDDQTSGMKR